MARRWPVPPMARLWSRQRAARTWPVRPVLAVVAAAALAGGCAAVPTVGQPEPVTGASGQAEQQFVQPVPPVPDRTWTAQQIVQGFLAASASFASDAAAARRFLAPPLRRSFHPGKRSAVTVLDGPLRPVSNTVGSRNVESESTLVKHVSLTGQQLATISSLGQYIDNPGPRKYVFQLAKYHGQWLITQLPSGSAVLLTQSDVQQVYQPRNLYVFSPAAGTSLVPEPVFAPQEDTYADVARGLVGALIKTGQTPSWLSPATITAFPAGTLLRSLSIVGSDAVVDLGGTVAGAAPQELRRMADQLVATLTSTSYGQAPISKSVTLKINGRMWDQALQDITAKVPGAEASSAPLYYINAAGAVSELEDGQARPVRGPAGRGEIPLGTIAVSPGKPTQLAGTLATGSGCVIYYGSLSGSAVLSHRTIPGGARCSSLSWDSLGDIWVVSGVRTWVLPAGSRQPVQVNLPPLPGTNPPSYQVLSLRVAPDSVRVAMLVKEQDGTRAILLSSVSRAHGQIEMGPGVNIIGTSLSTDAASPPSSLSWYDPDHLIVLAGTQLYEVPVNGGDAIAGGPVPRGAGSITSAGPGRIAAVSQGEILTSSGPQQIQQPAFKGTSPAYPG